MKYITPYKELYRLNNEPLRALLTCAGDNSIVIDNDCSARLYWDHMPHLLIAGATGSGKSVLMHDIILAAIMSANNDIAVIDLKRVELIPFYKPLPCMWARAAASGTAARELLQRVVNEMEYRYKRMARAGARKWGGRRLIIFIDELAELVTDPEVKKECMRMLSSLGRLGRAAGIHLVCATQYPTAKVLDSQILQNMPTRICLHVQNATASRVVLGHSGAELLQDYTAIIQDSSGRECVIQTVYASDNDISDIVSWYKKVWF